MPEIFLNMHIICRYMQYIYIYYALNMQKICKYIDCTSQVLVKYVKNMHEICQKYAQICR